MSIGIQGQTEMKTSSLRDGPRPTLDPLTTSPQIDQIATAMAMAQAGIQGAKKDSDNPFFKSKYADLASVVLACREALTANGIAVIQVPSGEGRRVVIKCYDKDDKPLPDGEGMEQRLTTLLIHSSGQWIGGTFTALAGDITPQALVACTTYMRRCGLAAVAGVAPEDDDGNEASGRAVVTQRQTPPRQQTGLTPDRLMKEIADLARQLKLDKPEGEALTKKALGKVKSSDLLTAEEAGKLIVVMTDELARRDATGKIK